MKPDTKPKPIPFEMALRAFTATVAIETSPSGARVPTIRLSSSPDTPARTLKAACHYLALLAELGSGPSERWIIRIEAAEAGLGRICIESASPTDDELARAVTVLEDVTAAAQLSHSVSPSKEQASP
jgi:hypothetical protein